MSNIEELDKITRAIADAQIRLKSIQSNIEQINKEISVLNPRKSELEKNIEFHKKSNTVPIAQEYKKAKAELSKVKARLIMIISDQKRSSEACNQIEDIIEKFKKDHAELLKNNENNVLTLFGGNRGKK